MRLEVFRRLQSGFCFPKFVLPSVYVIQESSMEQSSGLDAGGDGEDGKGSVVSRTTIENGRRAQKGGTFAEEVNDGRKSFLNLLHSLTSNSTRMKIMIQSPKSLPKSVSSRSSQADPRAHMGRSTPPPSPCVRVSRTRKAKGRERKVEGGRRRGERGFPHRHAPEEMVL